MHNLPLGGPAVFFYVEESLFRRKTNVAGPAKVLLDLSDMLGVIGVG